MMVGGSDEMVETLRAVPSDALLEPVWNFSSPHGYFYNGVPALSREDFAANLERLADQGYLERVFVDRLSLCPNCDSPALNVQEICSSCGSSHLERFVAYFHFRCGYVGAQTSFKLEPGGMRCPKCKRILADLGTDYDSPGTFFRCLACTAEFQTPHIGGRCLRCSCRFDQAGMQNAHERDVFAYRLTESGQRALKP
jgi:hypothetical protein